MTLYDRPRHQVLIGDRDLSERCDSIVYSATDTGGYEICTLGLPAVDRPRKGQPITIRQGLEIVWQGRVAEIADHSQHDRATKTTGGEGYRALLRDALIQQVYLDRDLSRWGPQSVTRQVALVASNFTSGSSQAAPDATSGSPALMQTITDSWVAPFKPLSEAWYDAGPGNLIAKIYTSLTTPGESAGDANWSELIGFSPDAFNIPLQTSNLHPSASGYVSAPGGYRYVLLQQEYLSTPAGQAGAIFKASWAGLAVYGNHGVSGAGSDPQGFHPSDIVLHALSQCASVSAGTIVQAAGYIIPHLVYRTPTAADVIIDDMARLMGWPWGVWEPPTILGSGPRLDFRPPPTDATCVITKAECDQLDITSRLGDLYDTAIVTYTDEAGASGQVSVFVANPQLAETGLSGRELLLDIGLGSAQSAQAFATFALALAQVSARAAGQATLPVSVRLPGGGSKPACLIRPGLDRLRVVDLVDGGPMLDMGATRRDTFRISRVETTVARDGSSSTRVELDSGTNLLETLQARLALAAGVVGSGASG